jgi:L-alanine-DL-glutamate epimerase-like enolase superfamily enzyme
VCAAVPNFQVLEFHHLDNTLWQDLTVEKNLIQNGHIAVPTAPGLGVTLDEDVARNAAREILGF